MPIFVNLKTNYMKVSKLAAVTVAHICILFIVACSQSTDQANTTKDSVSVKTADAPVIKSDTTEQVYNDYIKLKDVLVLSDAAKAQEAGKNLANSLSKIKGCENTAALASKIASTTDLASQRTDFTALSADVIALMKHSDLTSGKFFVQHCPMANDGEGGYWLSSQEEIRNPYYGDEMLECGSVKETIAAK